MTEFLLPSVEKRRVAVLGGGVLGRRIACVWAAKGFDVRIRDPSEEQRISALHYCKISIAEYVSGGESVLGHVEVFESLQEAVAQAWLVIECVPERLPLKIDTLADLEKCAPADAILCTNSSSYKSREMLAKVGPSTKRRFLNMHFMMPPRNRVVELMTDGETEPSIFPFLATKLQEAGMHPIVAHKESTGFVINRMWAAIKREALTILSEEVCSPEELDAVFIEMFTKSAAGPCMMMDAVGLDTVSFIEQHYATERGLDQTHTTEFLKPYLEEGRIGAKSPKGGFYPPGSTTKAPGETKGHYDNIHAPTIYFLDIGLSNEPQEAFNKGRILAGSPDGQHLQTLVDHQHLPDGLQISLPSGKLFWTSMGVPSHNDGAILRSNLDGSNVEEIVGNGRIHTPKQLAVDEKNGKIYVSDREGLRVMRCGLDGTDLETLIETGDYTDQVVADDQNRWCVGVAVSPETRHFYWTQKGPSKGSQGRIFRAGMNMPDGQDARTRDDIECLFSGLPEPVDIEIDDARSTIYWSDRGELPVGNSINRAKLSALKAVEHGYRSLPGRDYEILVRNLHEAIGIKLDEKNGHIYATDLGGCVYRFDLNGKNKKKLYEDQGAFTGITLAYT